MAKAGERALVDVEPLSVMLLGRDQCNNLVNLQRNMGR